MWNYGVENGLIFAQAMYEKGDKVLAFEVLTDLEGIVREHFNYYPDSVDVYAFVKESLKVVALALHGEYMERHVY